MKGRFNNKQSAFIILYTILRYIIAHQTDGGKRDRRYVGYKVVKDAFDLVGEEE